eukprot:superscaffoldBa00000009_g199
MEVNTAPQRRVYISLPKKYMASLAEHYELDHGLVIKDLNPYLNEGYVQAYFREWGTITACKIKKNPNSGNNKTLAYVRFSTEEEADRADWAGPHFLGGSEVEVKRVVSPKDAPIGSGGFGSVYAGFRKEDCLPVAIKHIPTNIVRRKRVVCNGKVFDIILEVAFMLKTAGLPGSVGQSAAISLLDWYTLENELILVLERPAFSLDLQKYLKISGGSLPEHEAKMILKQLVDAAIDVHTKGVFHRDIKLENTLIQWSSTGAPRLRLIDFGCGSFSTERSYYSFCGTPAYAPPEWFDCHIYWARPTTVWQLGALFYSLLDGREHFSTTDFINNHIKINSALSQVSGDAVLLMAEMLKIFVQEAAVRSQKQAESEDCDQVDIEHFEKILPQLLLDF